MLLIVIYVTIPNILDNTIFTIYTPANPPIKSYTNDVAISYSQCGYIYGKLSCQEKWSI